MGAVRRNGRRRPAFGVGAPAFAAALLLAGCLESRSDRPLGSSCSGSSDCAAGLLCSYGRCRAECSFDRDCPEGLACSASAENPSIRGCVLPDERGCTEDPEICPDGMGCGRDDVCHDLCSDLRPCGDGRVCDGVTWTCLDARDWDVEASFGRTDFEAFPVQIFGEDAEDGVWVRASLDGTTDATYEVHGYYCNYLGEDLTAPQTWDVERESVDPTNYAIRVRGRSTADCALGQPRCSGELRLNHDALWHIASVESCVVGPDTEESNGAVIETWCDADVENGTISWQSGSACRDCCACHDGALVDIEVVVSTR